MEYEYILLIVLGVFAGVLGGLLGIGGSVVMIPAMVWLLGASKGGVDQIHQYQGAAMIVNFMLAGPSALKHFRAKAIYKCVWKVLVPTAAVGVLAGVACARIPILRGEGAVYLRYLLGLFLVYVAGYNVYKMLRPPSLDGISVEEAAKVPFRKKGMIGIVMGFISGLLGLGGGAQAVPMMQIILKMPLRNSIATSAATIFCVSWIGAIAKNVSLGSDGSPVRSLVLAACLTPTAMIGGYVGGHLTHTLPIKYVRIVFIIVMGLAAWKMLTA